MQPDEVPVFGIHQRDLYIATLLIIFGGIGKQVVENLVQLVRIKITDNRLRITEYGEMYLALFDKRQERFGFIFSLTLFPHLLESTRHFRLPVSALRNSRISATDGSSLLILSYPLPYKGRHARETASSTHRR